MKKQYITDVDFIQNYRDLEKYNLLYGVLYHIGCIQEEDKLSDIIYRLLVNLIHKQCSKTLAIVKVKKWIKLYDDVINSLQLYDNSVFVTVPFCGLFNYPIEWLIEHYMFAKDILTEFEKQSCENIEFIEDNLSEQSYPIPSMSELFGRLIQIGKLNLNKDDNLDNRKLIKIIDDEMERRFISNTRQSYFDTTMKVIPEDVDTNEYLQHIYNGERALYVKYEKEVTRQLNEHTRTKTSSKDTDNVMMTTGVIYFLVDAILKETVTDETKKKLTKITTDFFTNREGDKVSNQSSIYRYLNCKLKDAEFINKTFKKDFIKAQLSRYKLDIPSILED